MTAYRRISTPWDVVLILTLLAVTVVWHSVQHKTTSTESVVCIYIDNRLYARYPLSQDKTVNIPGTEGDATLQINGGAVQIIKSPCRNQICVKSGAIKSSAASLVCVPGHFIVRIRSKDGEEFDAIVQ